MRVLQPRWLANQSVLSGRDDWTTAHKCPTVLPWRFPQDATGLAVTIVGVFC